MFLFMAASAWASPYNVTFCAKYDVVYTDASSYGDDYVTTNGVYPARGARIKVVRNSDGYVVYDGFSQDSGTTPGCIPALSLVVGQTYNVKVQSYASVNNNTLYVYDNNGAFGLGISGYGPAAYAPTSNATYNITTPSGVTRWNIANAVGHAMWRRAAGLSGEVFELVNADSPAGYGGCYDRTDDLVYLSSTRADDKYVIVHEFGHMLTARANYEASCASTSCAASNSYAATVDNCKTNDTNVPSTTHEANSKEYQSAALWEGIAHYYAAVAFNQTDQSDCTWVYYKNTDWNLNGNILDSQETVPIAVSCEDYPTVANFSDYLGVKCNGILENRGTEYDWLRFFWDLDTDQGVSTTSIYEIWNAANPHTWNSTGNGYDNYTDTSPCVTPVPSYPTGRLRCAAFNSGHLTAWDGEDTFNGVYR